MATFNVDSLDFSDDEEVRVGSDDEYGLSYDSGDDALEIEDRVNSVVASIPRGTSTDLVGGKFAETVSEGKALADDGSVYDTIQQAVDSASSWVKVGPGTFNESVTIDTAGLTLEGSGSRTEITVNLQTTASDCVIRDIDIAEVNIDGASNLLTRCTSDVIKTSGDGSAIVNCTVNDTGLYLLGNDHIATGNKIDAVNNGVLTSDSGETNILISNNIISSDKNGILLRSPDSIVIGNFVLDADRNGVSIEGDSVDSIVANNRISNTTDSGVNDEGIGTVLDSNLITE